MIKVKNLTKHYGKKENRFTALKDISFQIQNGESVAIVGKSGSGKSTLMHIMSGLDSPDKGEVIIDGKSLFKLKGKEMQRFRNREMGFIFQTFYLMPNETVIDNVMLPLEIEGISKARRKEVALVALDYVELLDKVNNKAKDLSGGQKQRVCIARAIVTTPKIIFADEPTGNLDTETGEKVIQMLFEVNSYYQSSLVIVTHDEDLAAKCNRRIYLKDGEIVKID
jgi:putative ABC transport system ATP-binding protein